MPGVYQLTLDLLEEEIHELRILGIKAILLFGIPSWKDDWQRLLMRQIELFNERLGKSRL